MASKPSLKDLDFASIRTVADAKEQAEIFSQIAAVKVDQYYELAPERVKELQDHGISKELVVGTGVSAISLAAVITLVLFGAQILSVFVSVLQPMYFTYKALETEQKDDDTEWLTYWFVFGVLQLLEHTILLPVTQLLPGFYYCSKMLLQLWMVNANGSMLIYNRYLAPFLRKHEKQLDSAIEQAKEEVKAAVTLVKPTHKPAGEEPEADI